jgi:hypothetical protein
MANSKYKQVKWFTLKKKLPSNRKKQNILHLIEETVSRF